jgi:hypothetical protein
MSGPDIGMSMEQWKHVLRTAATVWDFDDFFTFATTPTPTETWWAALRRFQTHDVAEGFTRLALTLKFRPKLSEIVEATREAAADRQAQERKAAQDSILKLTPPSQRTVEARLQACDQAAQQWRFEQRAELEVFGRHYQRQRAEVDVEAERLDEPGPFALRARELLAGQVEPGVGIDAMLRDFAQASESESAHDSDAASPRSA